MQLSEIIKELPTLNDKSYIFYTEQYKVRLMKLEENKNPIDVIKWPIYIDYLFER